MTDAALRQVTFIAYEIGWFSAEPAQLFVY